VRGSAGAGAAAQRRAYEARQARPQGLRRRAYRTRGLPGWTNGRRPRSKRRSSIQLRGIFRQPEIIVGTWRAARAEQDDITEDEAREALLQLDPLWDELFPAEQARIVQLLVERVDVGVRGAAIRLRANGLAGLVREVAGVGRRAAA